MIFVTTHFMKKKLINGIIKLTQILKQEKTITHFTIQSEMEFYIIIISQTKTIISKS